jgi:hypothetical protein
MNVRSVNAILSVCLSYYYYCTKAAVFYPTIPRPPSVVRAPCFVTENNFSVRANRNEARAINRGRVPVPLKLAGGPS